MCMNGKNWSFDIWHLRWGKMRKTILSPPIEHPSSAGADWTPQVPTRSLASSTMVMGRGRESSQTPAQFCLHGSGIIKQPQQWTILKKKKAETSRKSHRTLPFEELVFRTQGSSHALQQVMAVTGITQVGVSYEAYVYSQCFHVLQAKKKLEGKKHIYHSKNNILFQSH